MGELNPIGVLLYAIAYLFGVYIIVKAFILTYGWKGVVGLILSGLVLLSLVSVISLNTILVGGLSTWALVYCFRSAERIPTIFMGMGCFFAVCMAVEFINLLGGWLLWVAVFAAATPGLRRIKY